MEYACYQIWWKTCFSWYSSTLFSSASFCWYLISILHLLWNNVDHNKWNNQYHLFYLDYQKNKRIDIILATIFGFTLMMWITIQFVIFPLFIIDLVYFLFVVFQLIIGYISLVSYYQFFFKFNEEHYPDIREETDTCGFLLVR